MRIIKDTNYDFMSKVGITRILSILVLSIGLISLIINKGPKLSIDFNGGTMVVMNFEKAMDIEELRTSLNEIIIDGQIFDLSIEKVQTSCGWAVPEYEFKKHRNILDKSNKVAGEKGIRSYWKSSNTKSLDGLKTNIIEKNIGK